MAVATKKGRKRTKLVESQTEALLRKRGIELLGVILAGVAYLVTAALWTYNPADPSLFSATSSAPTNALGLVGASAADLLHRALGWAAYGVPVSLAAWGLRLMTHKGETRAVSRAITVPIAIAVASVFAAAHAPLDGWSHAYGLGGMFGDAVLTEVMRVVPLTTGLSLKATTLALALLFLAASGFALGIDMAELRQSGRFLVRSAIMGFAGLVAGLGLAGRASVTGARKAAVATRERHKRSKVERAERQARAREFAAQKLDPNIGPEGQRLEWNEATERMPSRLDEEEQKEARLREMITAAIKKREEKPSKKTFDAAKVVIPPPPGAEGLPSLEGVTRNDSIGAYGIEDAGPIDPNDVLGAGGVPERELVSAFHKGPRVQHPDKKPAAMSDRAREEAQPKLPLGTEPEPPYNAPPLSLLANPSTIVRHHLSDDALESNARMLESVLDDYGVKGEIVSVRPGPVVTMYELEPAAGVKASRVIGLADDIARSMSALSARVSTIPGRSVIGIELPNEHREKVLLREILSSRAFGDSVHALPLALGKDISGEPVVANLSRMPHLLIAGTTGSGKSVAINTMILSLLYRLSPADCRVIMIDPKMLELSVYDGIPHLLSPVVTDPKKAVVALKWVVAEMEERYRRMSKMGVRNIDGYNGRVRDALEKGEGFTRTVQTGFDDNTGEPVFETEEYAPETMPYIVVIVDEMADLMMVAGKEIEACIQRLAQMARASGIHLIMATQRPSVDVITGTIKANFPTRISFQVTSKIDSRTILGEQGAEQLLGQGDMLFMAGGGRITRVHGPFVSDEEVEEVVNHLKLLGEPEYVSGVVEGPDEEEASEIDQVLGLGGNTNGDDALYDQAVAIVVRDRKCSTSYIQRKLAIGYNKAARLVEMMEDQGVVSAANQVGKREILVPER